MNEKNVLIGAQVFCWPKIINQLGQKSAFGRFLSCVGIKDLFYATVIVSISILLKNQYFYNCVLWAQNLSCFDQFGWKIQLIEELDKF